MVKVSSTVLRDSQTNRRAQTERMSPTGAVAYEGNSRNRRLAIDMPRIAVPAQIFTGRARRRAPRFTGWILSGRGPSRCAVVSLSLKKGNIAAQMSRSSRRERSDSGFTAHELCADHAGFKDLVRSPSQPNRDASKTNCDASATHRRCQYISCKSLYIRQFRLAATHATHATHALGHSVFALECHCRPTAPNEANGHSNDSAGRTRSPLIECVHSQPPGSGPAGFGGL